MTLAWVNHSHSSTGKQGKTFGYFFSFIKSFCLFQAAASHILNSFSGLGALAGICLLNIDLIKIFVLDHQQTSPQFLAVIGFLSKYILPLPCKEILNSTDYCEVIKAYQTVSAWNEWASTCAQILQNFDFVLEILWDESWEIQSLILVWRVIQVNSLLRSTCLFL